MRSQGVAPRAARRCAAAGAGAARGVGTESGGDAGDALRSRERDQADDGGGGGRARASTRRTPLGRAASPRRAARRASSAPLELFLAHRAGLDGASCRSTRRSLAAGGRWTCAAALREAASARRDRTRAGSRPPRVRAALQRPRLRARGRGARAARRGARRGRGDRAARPRAARARAIAPGRCASSRRAGRRAARSRPTEDVAWRGGPSSGAVHDENAWALTGPRRLGARGHLRDGRRGARRSARPCSTGSTDAGLRRPPTRRGSSRERPGGTLRAGLRRQERRRARAPASASGRASFGHLGFTGTSLWIDPDAARRRGAPHEPRVPDARAPGHPRSAAVGARRALRARRATPGPWLNSHAPPGPRAWPPRRATRRPLEAYLAALKASGARAAGALRRAPWASSS